MYFSISKDLNVDLITSVTSGLESFIAELEADIIDSNLEDVTGMESLHVMSSSIAEAGISIFGLEAEENEAAKTSKVKAFVDKLKDIWRKFVNYFMMFLDGYIRRYRSILKHLEDVDNAITSALELPNIDSKEVTIKNAPIFINNPSNYTNSAARLAGLFGASAIVLHKTKFKQDSSKSDEDFVTDMNRGISGILAGVDLVKKANDESHVLQFGNDNIGEFYNILDDIREGKKIPDESKNVITGMITVIDGLSKSGETSKFESEEISGKATDILNKMLELNKEVRKTMDDSMLDVIVGKTDIKEFNKGNLTDEELSKYSKETLELVRDIFTSYRKTYKGSITIYLKFIKSLYKAEMSVLKQISSKKSSNNEKE